MKNHDFDEEIEETNYNDEPDFPDDINDLNTNLSDNDNSQQEIEKENTKQSTGKIEISIDSVEKLISNLSFSAQELEAAVEKVENNRELSEILNVLSDLKAKDVSDYLSTFEQKLEKAIKSINLQKIETNLEQKLENNLANILNATKKYEQYAEVFEDQEILNTFEQIENLEKFTKSFKFKSIVYGSIISLIVGLSTSYVATYSYFKFTEEKKIAEIKENIFDKKNELLKIFQNKEFEIVTGVSPSTNKQVSQIIFPLKKNKQINFFTTNNKDKSNILEFEK